MPLTLPLAPTPPTLANPGDFETNASASLAWMMAMATAMSGSVMLVGDFGLGTGAGLSPPFVGSDWNNAVTTGFYRAGSGQANAPEPTSGYLVQVISYGAGTFCRQIAFSISASPSSIYTRSRNGSGVWGSWVLTYNQTTILGAVSQASGVPTGAIIERGSNANGEYVKFADGTLICRGVITVGSYPVTVSSTDGMKYGAILTNTWPAAFVNVPAVSFSRAGGFGAWIQINSGNNTATTGNFAAGLGSTASNTSLSDMIYSFLAVGRWF